MSSKVGEVSVDADGRSVVPSAGCGWARGPASRAVLSGASPRSARDEPAGARHLRARPAE